ncbi:MAG TPA: hypothetical protein VN706_13980 [Gemmatimonadaceae bacterium]|nr:hypothetical protein [Gemmatimonadaceae bacterium]
MADETRGNDGDTAAAHDAGGAAKRSDVHDTSRQGSGGTEAGQEARRGVPPGEHDDEHQSNYGGGGPHGGAK